MPSREYISPSKEQVTRGAMAALGVASGASPVTVQATSNWQLEARATAVSTGVKPVRRTQSLGQKFQVVDQLGARLLQRVDERQPHGAERAQGDGAPQAELRALRRRECWE